MQYLNLDSVSIDRYYYNLRLIGKYWSGARRWGWLLSVLLLWYSKEVLRKIINISCTIKFFWAVGYAINKHHVTLFWYGEFIWM